MIGGETVSVQVSIIDLVVVRFAPSSGDSAPIPVGSSGGSAPNPTSNLTATLPRIEAMLMRRAAGTRCTGAWEIVHGRIEAGERPEAAARRELREETGFTCDRLYNVTLGGFYLHRQGVLSLTVVFCAIVAPDAPAPELGVEHDAYEWLPIGEAMERCAWPREREAMQHIAHLLRNGRDGGAVEDVLRVF